MASKVASSSPPPPSRSRYADNAHAAKPPKKFKFAGRRLPYHHRHRTSSDKGVPYLFESPQRLLEDFFAEADRVIKEAQE